MISSPIGYRTKLFFATNSRGERVTFVQQFASNDPETPLLSAFAGVLSEQEAIQRLINMRHRWSNQPK